MPCPHHNVQQFTETCLDCGANIYETDVERTRRLKREISHMQGELAKKEADTLEEKRNELRNKLYPPVDPDIGW